MREYMDFLLNHPTGSAHFCIDGFENEMASLPAGYIAPGGILIAHIDAQPLGCIAIRELRVVGPMAAVHEADGGGLALEIKRLWVRPSGRGLGLGRRLVEAALAHARLHRAVAVFLDTVPAAMPEATGLYHALGFESISRYNSNDLNGVAYFRLRLHLPMEPMVVTREQNPTK
jgi:ribosomal protein S18 acetylase RimI-like enzyme